MGTTKKTMFETNMQTTFPKVVISSYDVQGVLDGYRQTKAEKPEECTVLPRILSENFPQSMARTFYVKSGADSSCADGSKERPFAQITDALAALSGGQGGVIRLLGGLYGAFALESCHSGKDDAPLFIEAEQGENVTFSLGKTFSPDLLVPVEEASFVTDGERARLNRFTEGNSRNVYALDLTTVGFKKEDFAPYAAGDVSAPMYVGEENYIVARFPNKDQEDAEHGISRGRVLSMNTEEGKLNVKKNGRVTWGASTLYTEHKDEEGSWELYIDDTAYGARAIAYENPYNNLYAYGSVYEEWDVNNFYVSIKEEDGHHILVHNAPSSNWGCKPNAHTAFYFHNMLEDLDCEGEYLIDYERMVLFVYGRPSDAITIVPEKNPVITVNGAKHTVFRSLHFCYTQGAAVHLFGTERVFFEDCSFRTIGGMALNFINCRASGALYNHFRQCKAIGTTFKKAEMKPSCNIFQNNLFDNRDGTQASACMVTLSGGYGDLFSHNDLFDCNMSVGDQFDLVLEYNEFVHGNRFVRDNGPVYGGVSNRGMHIRYNYIHDLNYSQYGIYLDDMASGNYIYGNLIHYQPGKGARCINLHNGAMTVIDNNLCINARTAITNEPNYAAYTINGERTGAGGGQQSWFAIANTFLYKQFHAGNEKVFYERYPLYAWMNEFNDRSVAKMNANPNWVLFDKISPDEDDEIFTRRPAFNAYTNNVTYSCRSGYSVPEYAKETCIVENNLEYAAEEDIGLVTENGRMALSEDSRIYRENPQFEALKIARAGRIKD
ncbi:MAG: right-handed parallel beta-helix repeat-containing protein [Clostridia bacterium]|nr:right-handed parallel beta-helix repeat-containing protein [Clostridia bacterium]